MEGAAEHVSPQPVGTEGVGQRGGLIALGQHRAKAIIACNEETGEVRSGQVAADAGFTYWLLKFDGVSGNRDKELEDPAGYGLIEYGYYLMAREAGIEMMASRLLRENGRSHFMTRRFDRGARGEKRFVQTLAALAHYDYYESGAHSYEQLFLLMRRLSMPQSSIEQMFRRVVFNLVGCNQDDHVKNFAFEMDRAGRWDLAPAYDLCHAEGSDFTRNHQLSVNGKTNDFAREDLKALADYAGLPQGRDRRVLEEVVDAFSGWRELADRLAIPQRLVEHVTRTQRLDW